MSERENTHLAAHRLDYLDSIRGLAAMVVLLSHTMGIFAWPTAYLAAMNWPFLNIFFNGKEAVAMFFVLSGYVLSKPYVSWMPGCGRTVSVPTFYLRRFIRIWLPWFSAFLVSLVVKQYFFTVPDTMPPTSSWFHIFWQNTPMTVAEFLRQCTFQQHDPRSQLLTQDWSLGVELKGSLLLPLFIWAARPGRLVLNFIAILVLVFVFHNGHYYISFIIGLLVARFDHVFYRKWSSYPVCLRGCLFLVGLILYQMFEVTMPLYKPAWIRAEVGWVLSATGCGCILLSVFASSRSQRLLNSRIPVFLGRISYSIYLLQFVILLAVMPHFLEWLNWLEIPMPLAFVLVVMGSLLATVGASTLMYYLVESNVITFGHWLTRKLEKKSVKVPREKEFGVGKQS